jgi:VanZ family protein
VIKSNKNYKPTVFFSLLIVGWIMGLFVESSQPSLPLLGAVEGLDKAAHFLAFGVLGLLVYGLSFTLTPKTAIPLFSMPLLIAILSGIIEESYQMFVPGRTASLLDLLADVCGAACAIVLANCITFVIRVNKQTSAKR